MARNEIVITSGKGGGRPNTSAVSTVAKATNKTSSLKGGGSSVKTIAKSMRTVRTLDTGALGLFGGSSGGAIGMLVQEGIKSVSKGIDIALDIGLARTGETVTYGNIKRLKGYVLNPTSFLVEATYGNYLRDMRVKRENISTEYYRNLTGNLIYSKQYGEK